MVKNGIMLHFRRYGDLDNVPFSRFAKIIAALLNKSVYVYLNLLDVKPWSEFASAWQQKYGLTDMQVRAALGMCPNETTNPLQLTQTVLRGWQHREPKFHLNSSMNMLGGL